MSDMSNSEELVMGGFLGLHGVLGRMSVEMLAEVESWRPLRVTRTPCGVFGRGPK